jgi:hypothetical protein
MHSFNSTMASSSSYAQNPAATIRLAFPTAPESSLGTLNLFILNNLLQYLCKCAQTHKSPISKTMNLLYVAIDPTLYGHYSGGKAYSNADYPFLLEVPDVPNYSGCTNTNDCANVKVTHSMALKQRNSVINMNSALIDAFLNLIPVALKQSYEQILMENPNSIFCKMLPGSWLSTAAHLRMTAKPIAPQWPYTDILHRGSNSLSCDCSGSGELHSPTSPSIPFPTMTSLTSAFASSIKLASLWRSTRPGSCAAITQPTAWSLPHSVPFGRPLSTLHHSRPPKPCNTAMA